MTFEGQYLTKEEYIALGGNPEIGDMPFNLLEFEARKLIDKYTFGRLQDLQEQNNEVKLCVYKLINLVDTYNITESQNKGISSESIDGYSISYGNRTTELEKAKNAEIMDIISTYLSECTLEDGTSYLYRGV